jgi:hypothetical protein
MLQARDQKDVKIFMIGATPDGVKTAIRMYHGHKRGDDPSVEAAKGITDDALVELSAGLAKNLQSRKI